MGTAITIPTHSSSLFAPICIVQQSAGVGVQVQADTGSAPGGDDGKHSHPRDERNGWAVRNLPRPFEDRDPFASRLSFHHVLTRQLGIKAKIASA